MYSVLLKRCASSLDPILVTRRTLFWGTITAIPFVAAEGAPFSLAPLTSPLLAGCLVFLGLMGSALCYVLWNHAIRILGVVSAQQFHLPHPLRHHCHRPDLPGRGHLSPGPFWEPYSSPAAW